MRGNEMKAFKILVLFITLAGVSCLQSPKETEEIKEVPIKEVVFDYNVKRDSFINSIIIKKPIHKEIKVYELFNEVDYVFLYDECKITIEVHNYVPYEQKYHIDYFCTLKNGNTYSMNDLNLDTYMKLQQLCLIKE
jgi:hypothetical protein